MGHSREMPSRGKGSEPASGKRKAACHGCLCFPPWALSLEAFHRLSREEQAAKLKELLEKFPGQEEFPLLDARGRIAFVIEKDPPDIHINWAVAPIPEEFFRVKRKTSRKKFVKKCREIGNRIKEMRILPVTEIIAKLNQILVGYFHYYGITDNFDSLNDFCYIVRRRLFYWLNRRSQKKSYNWTDFNNLLKEYPLARPKIYVSIYG